MQHAPVAERALMWGYLVLFTVWGLVVLGEITMGTGRGGAYFAVAAIVPIAIACVGSGFLLRSVESSDAARRLVRTVAGLAMQGPVLLVMLVVAISSIPYLLEGNAPWRDPYYQNMVHDDMLPFTVVLVPLIVLMAGAALFLAARAHLRARRRVPPIPGSPAPPPSPPSP